jgi:UDP-N-acetylmuramoyl-tripeptide--D-alanyl-D-alanine ligase
MMSLAEAARVTGGRVSGTDTRFAGVSTDSRSIGADELFVALRGERFDGHQFLGAAALRGACAALVDRAYQGTFPLPVLIVADTKRALGDLARDWRSRFSPALIAITGSNGKTTVKEMVAAILRQHAGANAVLATTGNLNNDIGVPLTLLRLRAEHRWCAIELGMNHPGEIAYLAGLAAPSVALVNNAQREHLEFMRNVDEVAAENASVYDALPPEGVGIVNADDAHAGFFRRRAGARKLIDFGIGAGAMVTGRYELKAVSSDIVLRTPQGEARATLAIPGLHNVRNALAAAACAHGAGIGATSIAAGLSAFHPYTGRLQIKQAARGMTVIDDSYNANPDSVRAAIDVLVSCPAPRVLVLGDMGEVGPRGPELHREIGAAAVHAVEAFGAGGEHFADVDRLVAAVSGRTVLVKGSRFMKMERVVGALTGEHAQGGH